MKISKTLSTLAIAAGLNILLYFFFLEMREVPPSFHIVIRYGSYVILMIGILISCFFNRSRVFFILITLFLCQYGLIDFRTEVVNKNFYLTAIYSAVCLLIPLNIAVFSFLNERGILTSRGKNRIIFIIAEIMLAFMVYQPENQQLINALNTKLISLEMFNLTPIPQFSILMMLVAFLILLTRQYLNVSAYESPFISVLVSLVFALHFKENLAIYTFFSASALTLTVAVIKDLYSKAYLDELTGLPNRRALKEEALKTGNKYTMAMLDIDFFKKFNDTYGHDVGDDALRFVASMIKDVAGGGKAYRYGGEEFTIIFPEKGIDDSLPHLDDLREKISKRGFALRGKDRPKRKPKKNGQVRGSSKQLYLTVSIGASEKTVAHKTAEDVIKSADKALYRAKKNGRNCVSK